MSDTNTLQVINSPAVANLMDAGRFNQMMSIASTMADAALIPDHLWCRKKGQNVEPFTYEQVRANCFLIVNQAFRWGMDPFAVMPETYVVGGKLAYQGKLIAGVANALANLDGRLNYEFSGQPGTDDFTITVSGKFKGAEKPVSVQVSVGQAKTDNQMWRKDPEQKLVYTGATKWARRYCPEIVLGILTDDDADAIEMRETKGRVVEHQTQKVVTGESNPISGKQTKNQKVAEAAESVEKVTSAEKPSAEIPPRPDIVAGVRTAFRAAGFKTLPAAEAQCIEKGVLPRGKSFSDLSDADLFVILQKKDEIFPVPVESEGAPAAEPQKEGGDQ